MDGFCTLIKIKILRLRFRSNNWNLSTSFLIVQNIEYSILSNSLTNKDDGKLKPFLTSK